ncbi:MAG TPA: hypothetical protein VHZ24_06820 [Pirellulales bacterium]|jgi:hypothetical protein|nr:hypothetical protein [Pirellulales bacterium]
MIAPADPLYDARVALESLAEALDALQAVVTDQGDAEALSDAQEYALLVALCLDDVTCGTR